MKSQNDRLLSHLRRGEAVTPMDAITALGIYRLGARVYDLKARGHPIHAEIVEVPNRYGGTSRVARYRMRAQ